MSAVINDFLKKSAARMMAASGQYTVVMGNEGGDMDSVVGSLYLAMLLDRSEGYRLGPTVPVVNFPLDELPLRNDVHKLMEELSVDMTQFFSLCPGNTHYLDLAQQQDVQIVLYDHNKLKADQVQFGARVVGVVDHHFDEQQYVEQTKDLRIIRTCGSACTLVAEMYRDAGVAVPCPALLAAPIILDTVNFEEAQKKVTPQDVDIFQWLCVEGHMTDYDHTAVFKKLSTWKNDIFSLTVAQNLKRDYKFFAFACQAFGKPMRCGIASVPCSYAEFDEKYTADAVRADCVAFAEKNELDAVVIAFAGKKDGVHSRQVAFCAQEPCFTILADYAASSPGEVRFQSVVKLDGADGFLFEAYSLSDPAVSRKRLVPSLTQFLKDGQQSAL